MKNLRIYIVLLVVCSSTLFADGSGVLTLFLFKDGKPIENASVSIDDYEPYKTNLDGSIKLTLPAGRHKLTIVPPMYDVLETEFMIIIDETTQLIFTLLEDGKFEIDTEYAKHKKELSQLQQTHKDGKKLKTGIVQGKILSSEEKTPVKNARIFIKGTAVDLTSDGEGEFILEIPEGTYTLSVIHPDFSTQTIDNLKVIGDAKTQKTIELTPAALELEEYVVLVPHIEGGVASLLEQRRESDSVADVIGAEQMSKSGDSNAAAALKRVTGLTVVGGKYVYVRGMGERYSSTLLNGATLPSPEPERRVVPLDLFPTGILESMEIQKTYSPDMPGEFGGGVIKLKTKGIPDEFFLSISLSTGFSENTFSDGLTYEGGKYDWLGFDDGTRGLASEIIDATAGGKELVKKSKYQKEGFTAEDIERLGEEMPNNWETENTMLPPDFGISISTGNRFSIISDLKTGFLVGLSYGNSWDKIDKRVNTWKLGTEGEPPVPVNSYQYDITKNNIKLGGIFEGGISWADDHKITSTTLLIRTSDNNTVQYSGYNAEISDDIRVTNLQWLEQMLFTEQIKGSHNFPLLNNSLLEWRYTYSEAQRDEPDRRSIRYDYNSEKELWSLTSFTKSNERVYSTLQDENHDFSADLTIPFPLWQKLEGAFKTGFHYASKDRVVDTRRFEFRGSSSLDESISTLPPEQIFTEENIGTELELAESTRDTDNYFAYHKMKSFYAMIRMPLHERFKLMGGIRYEDSNQWVKTYELYTAEPKEIISPLHVKDWLPAVTGTVKIMDEMQLRGGFSITLNRPDLRELSPATSDDVEGGGETKGNENLKRAKIYNYDLRWEWYFSTDENVSLAFFYKHFSDPIETQFISSSGNTKSFVNVDEAINYGFEIEGRKNFGFINSFFEDMYVSGNFAWIESKVDLDTYSRPLAGQSPFVLNMQLGYDNVESGTSGLILYNVFGERISAIRQIPAQWDAIEKSSHQLDLVLSQKLPYDFKVSFKAKNLLDLERKIYIDNKLASSSRKGREFSLGLSWKM